MNITIDVSQLEGMQEAITRHVIDFLSRSLHQEWYSLKAAAERKGVSLGTLRAKPEYQPRGGIPDKRLHGVKVWHHTTIEEWLLVTDETRADYLTMNARKFQVAG